MNNTEKFTNKVADYVKYRPKYPQEFINYLVNEVGLSKDKVVADIGAGTGILTKQLADKVKSIYAVEPNFNMRTACEEYCKSYENFIAIDGSAENTKLCDNSIDFITAAQAFHWFDRSKCKIEFERILNGNGKVILAWNSRALEDELVKKLHELFQRTCPDIIGLSGGSSTGPEEYSDFFKNSYCDYRVFDNDRILTLEEFIGGNLSASYAPTQNDKNYKIFIDGLTKLFHKYSNNGRLLLKNSTYSYVGEI